jgi:hypothetical protein
MDAVDENKDRVISTDELATGFAMGQLCMTHLIDYLRVSSIYGCMPHAC